MLSGVPTTHIGCVAPVSRAVRATENQYLINSQYILSSKHTLYERFIYQKDPQLQTFNCFINAGNCKPGCAHQRLIRATTWVSLKLTSVLTTTSSTRRASRSTATSRTTPIPLLLLSLQLAPPPRTLSSAGEQPSALPMRFRPDSQWRAGQAIPGNGRSRRCWTSWRSALPVRGARAETSP